MTTEHGPQRQDGEQTPNTEHNDRAEQTPHAPHGQGPYGQAPYGQASDGGQHAYGAMPPPPPPPAMWPGAAMPAVTPATHAASEPRKRRSRRTLRGCRRPVRRCHRCWRDRMGNVVWVEPADDGRAGKPDDPGLVDVTSTLGYQHATLRAPGRC